MKLEDVLDQGGREWCLRQACKWPISFSLVWPWLWPPDTQSWLFNALAPPSGHTNV